MTEFISDIASIVAMDEDELGGDGKDEATEDVDEEDEDGEDEFETDSDDEN